MQEEDLQELIMMMYHLTQLGEYLLKIFPEQDLVQGTTTVQNTLDLPNNPQEKGPYNNSTNEEFENSIDENWAGIMRPINSTNFEQSTSSLLNFGYWIHSVNWKLKKMI